MSGTVIEIVQTNDAIEPSFEVWQRQTLVFQPGRPNMVIDRIKLATAKAVPGPDSWPIPAEVEKDLSQGLSWYFEQYILNYSIENQKTSEYITYALTDWGETVFNLLFNNEAALNLYKECRYHEPSTRIEIFSDDPKVHFWPWEAILDFERYWVGSLFAFERVFTPFKDSKDLEHTFFNSKKINILLVTARTTNDVDYRFIGNTLATNSDQINLLLLQPPTLKNLKEVLENHGRQFDVVHFDCHGGFQPDANGEEKGHLMLENNNNGLVPVSAEDLCIALGPNCPPHIVINACRSAMTSYNNSKFSHSLAIKLLRLTQIYDVTAMSYNLSTDAMKLFLLPFYNGMLCNLRTSAAVEMGRRVMMRNKVRTCREETLEIEDWMIPVVYRKRLAKPQNIESHIEREVNFSNAIIPNPTVIDKFIGRDYLFYQFDRRLIQKGMMFLLHGLAGQGKTRFVKEYLTWRSNTGDKRISLWVDLEQQNSFSQLLITVASLLSVHLSTSIGPDHIENLSAQYVASNRFIIVLDNFHSIRDSIGLESAEKFDNAEKIRLLKLLKNFERSGSTIIAISRRLEKWTAEHFGICEFFISGIDDSETTELIDKVLSDFGSRMTSTQLMADKNFSTIISQYQGNPFLILDIVNRTIARKPIDSFLTMLGANVAGIERWYVPDYANKRLQLSLKVAEDNSIEILAQFLFCFEYQINVELLSEMIGVTKHDSADKSLSLAISKLRMAGMIDDRKNIHPLLKGLVKPKYSILNDKCMSIFTTAIKNLIVRKHVDLLIELEYFTLELFIRKMVDRAEFSCLTNLLHLYLNACNESGQNDRSTKIYQLTRPLLVGHITEKAESMLYNLWLSQETMLKLMPKLLSQINNGKLNSTSEVPTPGHDAAAAETHRKLAMHCIGERKYMEARAYLKRAIACNKLARDEYCRALNLSLLGEVEGMLKNLKKAEPYFVESIRILKDHDADTDAGISYHQWAKCLYFDGQIEKAGEYFLNAAELFVKNKDEANKAAVLRNFEIFLHEGNPPNWRFMNFRILVGFSKLATGTLHKFIGSLIVEIFANGKGINIPDN